MEAVKVQGILRPCCGDGRNLAVVERRPLDGKSFAVVRRCRLCGRRHHELNVEPIRFGITGK